MKCANTNAHTQPKTKLVEGFDFARAEINATRKEYWIAGPYKSDTGRNYPVGGQWILSGVLHVHHYNLLESAINKLRTETCTVCSQKFKSRICEH